MSNLPDFWSMVQDQFSVGSFAALLVGFFLFVVFAFFAFRVLRYCWKVFYWTWTQHYWWNWSWSDSFSYSRAHVAGRKWSRAGGARPRRGF